MLDFWPRRKTEHSKDAEDSNTEDTTFLDSKSKKIPDRYQGWRFGVLTCTASTCLVLLINISLALGALGKNGWGRDGQPVLYEGNCNTVSMMSTALHLLINGMSTALLCASSYCMQCLSSPTRQELDLAHRKRSWLDIGVLSPRNMKSISGSRRVRWLVLGLSTIPLHLFYNSVVFASTGTNVYWPLLVKESLLDPASDIEPYMPRSDFSLFINGDSHDPSIVQGGKDEYPAIDEAKRLKDIYATGGLQRLENIDCLKAYTTQFQPRGSVLLVTTNDTMLDHAVASFGGNYTTQYWICGDSRCDNSFDSTEEAKNLWGDPKSWNYGGVKVEYCLSEVPRERCRLQLSLPIAIIVVFFNAMKAICMVTILFRLGEKMSSPPIMNLGDTVASFLERSDPQTKNMSLTSLDNLRKSLNMRHQWDTRAREVKGRPAFRFGAASRTRWIVTVVLYSSIIAFAIWLLMGAMITTRSDGSSDSTPDYKSVAMITSIGWGKVDSRTMIEPATKDLITNAMIANSPQLILSWVYFSYNGLLTLMALAREWESYAQHRKGLRVTSVQQGHQRSTYFLQLPYKIAIPFMIISGFLHWLVSQSFFLVSVQQYSYDKVEGWKAEPDTEASRVSIGYSLLPMVVGVVTGGCLLFGILAVGFTRFKTVMPVVSSCSAAISSACQPLGEDDSEAAISKVQWGVMGRLSSGFQHCGFARTPVRQPVPGEGYR